MPEPAQPWHQCWQGTEVRLEPKVTTSTAEGPATRVVRLATRVVRENAGFVPDIFSWLDGPFVSPHPVAAQAMRMEEHLAGGRYVVRAELPGVDPAKDMNVSVAKGILTIRAERHEERQGQHRSEFRYGTFTRHIALPVTADANDIKATYHWGILEVSIGLHAEDEDTAGRRIPIRTTAP